jgi:lysophospholipase L1-like esterase
VVVALGLAVASFHVIEQPIRHGWPALRANWQRVALVPVSMVATAAAVMFATVPPAVATASSGHVVVVTQTKRDQVPGAGGVVGKPILLGYAVSHKHPLRILLLGDSVMLSESPAVEALFDSTHAAVVENHSQWGFGLTTLKGWQSQVSQWIAQAKPQVVVAMWSWDNAALAAHPAAYTAELESFVRLLLKPGSGVKGVIFQQFPAPGTDLVKTTNQPDYPARVASLINRFDRLAVSLTKVFPGRVMYVPIGNAVLLGGHFATWLPPEGRPDARKNLWLRVRQVDNVHFCPAGAARYAAALLADLTPMYHLPHPSATWLKGSWVHNYLAYRYPDAGVCPDDHP